MTPSLQYIDTPSRQEMADSMSKNYLINKPLGFTVKENTVLDGNGKFSSAGNVAVKEHLQGTWVFLGEWLSIWGHCITDNLKKLWFIKTQIFNELGGGICISSHSDISANFAQLLTLVDIDVDKIKIIRENTLIDKVVIPDDSIIVEGHSRFYYQEYADIVNQIRDAIPIDTSLPDKIYFTRTKLQKQKDFGEKPVENMFKQLGFQVYTPEQLTLIDQLKLLKNCKEFATTEGSIAHNIIFCQNGVSIIIIRKICAMISYQFMLNDIRKANVTYIDSHSTLAYVGSPWNGPFLLKVNHNLIDFANSRGLTNIEPHLSLSATVRYIKNIIYKSLRYRKPIHTTPHLIYFLRNTFK